MNDEQGTAFAAAIVKSARVDNLLNQRDADQAAN